MGAVFRARHELMDKPVAAQVAQDRPCGDAGCGQGSLHAGGACGSAHPPSQRGRRLRRRRARGRPVHGDGAARGRDLRRPARAQRLPHRRRRSATCWPRDARRRRRARRRHHAPRHQAREHLHRAATRTTSRASPRSSTSGSPSCTTSRSRTYAAGHRDRHAPLHVLRADAAARATSTSAPTSTRSACCSTRRSPASCRSMARRLPRS